MILIFDEIRFKNRIHEKIDVYYGCWSIVGPMSLSIIFLCKNSFNKIKRYLLFTHLLKIYLVWKKTAQYWICLIFSFFFVLVFCSFMMKIKKKTKKTICWICCLFVYGFLLKWFQRKFIIYFIIGCLFVHTNTILSRVCYSYSLLFFGYSFCFFSSVECDTLYI